jgi:hypothetical protein
MLSEHRLVLRIVRKFNSLLLRGLTMSCLFGRKLSAAENNISNKIVGSNQMSSGNITKIANTAMD